MGTLLTSSRLKTPVSLYRGVSNKFLGHTTIGEIFTRMTDPNNTGLVDLSDRLKLARNEAPAEYTRIKETECPAYIIGKFPQKRDASCEHYEPLLAFDIDHVSNDWLIETTLDQVKTIPFVYAAYPSVSRQGIRILVWTESDQHTHKLYYQALCNILSLSLSIPTDKQLSERLKAEGKSREDINRMISESVIIDTSTCNPARIWFYSHVPEDLFYLNENSQVFYSTTIDEPAKPAKPSRHQSAGAGHRITEDEKVTICQHKVQRQNIPAGRNNFVYAIASELCRHGVPAERAHAECLGYAEADFDQKEIEKTVKSAYDNTSFGEFQDYQIAKYKRMLNNGLQPVEKVATDTGSNNDQRGVNFPIVAPPSLDEREISVDGCRTLALTLAKKEGEEGYYYQWTERDKKGHLVESAISNFIINPMYLLKHNRNPKRIIEVNNVFLEKATVCIEVRKMATVDTFKSEIEGKGNYVLKANRPQFDSIKEVIFFQESQAEEIDTLGWSKDHQLYTFSNGVFFGGDFYQVDSFGIAHTPKGKFYIPALSSVNENGAADYANERKFQFKPGNTSLSDWAQMVVGVYGENGKIGICFIIACLFRDFIFDTKDCFPLLFLFAPPQSGKSTFRDSFLALFGEPQTPISLESASSPKGFSRKMAQFANALIVFEEYKNRINQSLIGMLKSIYDGIGYERALMTNDNKTHSTPVLSGCMLVGQEVPTKENALFTRVLMLEFGRQSWSAEEKTQLDKLRKVETEGLGNVLFQMLQHRPLIESGFNAAFDLVFQDLRKDHLAPLIPDRHIKNAAILLAPFKLIAEKESLPFTYQDALKIIAHRLKEQAEMMSRTNEVNQFWEAFHYLKNEHRLSAEIHYKYGEENGIKLLYLIFNQVYPIYNEYMTRQGMNAVEQETLLRYLKQQAYFIKPQGKETKDCKKVGWSTRRAYLFKADDEPIIENEVE